MSHFTLVSESFHPRTSQVVYTNESCRTYTGFVLEAGGNMAQITASNDSEHALQGACVAMCCNVLQCVAVCCSVLQFLAVCCSVRE